MRGMSLRAVALAGVVSLACALSAQGTRAGAGESETELERLTSRLLAAPALRTEPGFTARLLVPPGQLYDPLTMIPRGDVVWVNDDGGEEGERGSRILSVDPQGRVSVVVGLGELLPAIGFDVAPPSFAPYAGEIFTLAQARAGLPGALADHVIQRVEPARGFAASVFCTLPPVATVEPSASGYGVEARFGPETSPFAGKLFAVTNLNATVHQVTPDGVCRPFVTFDPAHQGRPMGIQFTRDGTAMLVSLGRSDAVGAAVAGGGSIVRVRPDGSVEAQPLATGLTSPVGMDFAPPGFGDHGGQLFVADGGVVEVPVRMTQPVAADGKVLRLAADGRPHLVASGLHSPAGVRFVGKALWVSDLAGDFIGGRRELPDGWIATIEAR